MADGKKYLDKDGVSYLWGKIKSALDSLSARLTAVETPKVIALEIPFSFEVSDWSGSGPYTATVSSPSIIDNSIVLQPNITGGFGQLDPTWRWERVTNGVCFTLDTLPGGTINGAIPVIMTHNDGT